MTTMTPRTADFLLAEANGDLSREQIVIASGAGALSAGTVLGQITVAAATAAAIAGTGDATISTIAVGAGAQPGAYRLVAEAATKLDLWSPDGVRIGQATAGSAATLGGLTFTVTAGSTPMVAGDTFVITVAAGSGEYVPYDDDNTNGSDTAAGILFDAVDATDAAQDAVIIARNATVSADRLVWASTNDATDKTNGLADLAALNIIARS